jgi:hypothetical protein
MSLGLCLVSGWSAAGHCLRTSSPGILGIEKTGFADGMMVMVIEAVEET